MEISPEMVQECIQRIIKKHQPVSALGNKEYNSLTRELTEHAYSFAELLPPAWTYNRR